MARHRKIDVKLWGDEKFSSLSRPKPNAQTLWIFLLTGPQTTAAPGLFSSGVAALSEMLGWSTPAFRRCFEELVSAGMVKADWSSRVVWIPKAVTYNPAENPNAVKAWRRAIAEIPECALRDEAAAVLRAASGFPEVFELEAEEDKRGRLRFGSGKNSDDPSGNESGSDSKNGSRKSTGNQEQEQEQEQEQGEESPSPTRKRVARSAAGDPLFDSFWARYPKKVGKADAEKAWVKLTPDERAKACAVVSVYAEAMADRPQFVKDPPGWLNGKRFNDDPAAWQPRATGRSPRPPSETGFAPPSEVGNYYANTPVVKGL